MGIKSFLSRPLSKLVASSIYKSHRNGIRIQQDMLLHHVKKAQATAFGKDHLFSKISSAADYMQLVPVRDYEQYKPYTDRIRTGAHDILWPGKPLYLSKTSGTTSGIKYIPITSDSISNHINGARNALLMYIASTVNTGFVNGKMIFLSGSPELGDTAGIPTGRLSGIVNHHVPGYLRSNQLPSYATNCIDDWEQKVDAIVEETSSQPMTLISGIPPWVQMYFDRLTARHGKPVKDIFPEFSLFVYGGVSYEPYREKMEATIGKKIDTLELYPASEGFIAFQDEPGNSGLLLNLDAGIYFEFIKASEFFTPGAKRISLSEVETGVQYALLLTTDAGLWSYSIGDTIRFVSLDPYRIIVTGRIRHFISAFGEHVIAEEVEKALRAAASEQHAEVIEFTVAPQVNPHAGLPYHEWFIEFSKKPADAERFRIQLDESLQKLNIYYRDLISGNILQPLKITEVKPNGFISYMRSLGKLGGQNKVPRLSNDRQIADTLKPFTVSGS